MLTQQQRSGSRLMDVRWSVVVESELRVTSPAMSAMMAVLKLFSQREDTYAQVMMPVRQAHEMQHKAEKRARKFRKQARLLEQAQKDRND